VVAVVDHQQLPLVDMLAVMVDPVEVVLSMHRHRQAPVMSLLFFHHKDKTVEKDQEWALNQHLSAVVAVRYLWVVHLVVEVPVEVEQQRVFLVHQLVSLVEVVVVIQDQD
jgi:hypothetical protein